MPRRDQIEPDDDYDPMEDEIDLDEIAIAAMQGLLASGGSESPADAASIAWMAVVPAYIQARANFFKIAPSMGIGLAKARDLEGGD